MAHGRNKDSTTICGVDSMSHCSLVLLADNISVVSRQFRTSLREQSPIAPYPSVVELATPNIRHMRFNGGSRKGALDHGINYIVPQMRKGDRSRSLRPSWQSTTAMS